MPQRGGAFFGFGIVIAAALITWAIVALVQSVDDSSDDGYTPADNDIQDALNNASPGDTIFIPEGTHYISLYTVVDGTEDNPITIRGARKTDREDVVLRGDGRNSRVLEIFHSYYVIEDFTINGQHEDGDGFHQQLIFVEGSNDPDEIDGVATSITGIVIQDMIITNAGKECVRLKYFVTYSVLQFNSITNCGIEDYDEGSSGANGEGIYIGTATNQWEDGVIDVCIGNVVQNNLIDTQGSEGVDLKEGSIENVVQENDIYGMIDPESGAIGVRGDKNVIRYNTIVDSAGACVMIGGTEKDDVTYGTENEVYGNFFNVCEYAAIKVNESPQTICENHVTDPSDPDDAYLVVRGDERDDYPDITEDCPSTLFIVIVPSTPDPGDDDFSYTSTSVIVEGDDGSTGGGYDFVGCFDSGGGAVLTFLYSDEDGMTVADCVSACAVGGNRYAGLRAGTECYCGDDTDYDDYGTSICNMDCSGAPGTLCGGEDSVSVYEVYGNGGSDDRTDDDEGSYSLEDDDDDNRSDGEDDIINADSGGDDDDSTTTVVIVTSDDEPEPETDDNGGFVANGDYLGCYGDDDKDSILEFAYEDENDLTPEKCINSCAEAGEELAGLQEGKQCWCGTNDDYDRYGRARCNSPCTGDSTNICGGYSASSLYRVE